MMLAKVCSMINKHDGNYLFFEESNGRIYYSVVSRTGETLRTGEMIISTKKFVDYMQKVGFEYVN